MEKVDLLVHMQKVQLELNQLKKRQTSNENEKLIGELRNELAIKENECKTWMAKIEQADNLDDDLRSKDNIIEELNSSLNFETTKRKQMESMFQDLTDREKSVRQELDQSKNQKVSKRFGQLHYNSCYKKSMFKHISRAFTRIQTKK